MICVYPADCTDFSTNGNGPISPSSATVTETLNGEYELQIEHPIDDAGKWRRLVEGCILRAPVPAAMTPTVNFHAAASSSTSGKEVWRINTDIPTASVRGGTLRLRNGPGEKYKVLANYKNGSLVQVINKTNATWYECTAPDGKHGYFMVKYLALEKTESSYSAAVNSVVASRQLRDQPFRIYRVVPDLDKVTVYARHIFYDLLDNMIQSVKPSSSQVGASVVQAISSACMSSHDFTFYSDLDSTAEDVEYVNINPVDALLGDNGVVSAYAGELTRDWWDVFLVKRVGQDTNVQIRQGKNLLGVSYDIDLTDVVTRIMPTGEDADGNVLYLPETYVDSPLINAYPHPKWIHLAVSEAKEKTDGDDQKTKAQCYADMRAEAQKQFYAGCDQPTVTLTVDYINTADTEEYKEYSFLQNIYLGDAVRVIAPRIGIWVSMRMTQYTYDCLTRQYTKITLGTVQDTVEGNVISSRQLPSGIISGSKLAINSVGSGALQGGSVGSVQIKTAAIETAHIQDAAIGTAQVADAAIVRAKIAEGAIGSAQIDDASITRAKIADAAIGSAQIDTGVINTAHIGAGQIQEANIYDGAITHAKIAEAAVHSANIENGAIESAKIADAAITNAKIAGAAIGTANIQDGAIVRAKILDGEIVTAKIADLAVTSGKISDLAVTTAKIAQAAITNAQIANAAVDTAQIALGAITAALIQNGAVGTAQIADASITEGKIVSLNADVIQSGTLATERLIIRGEDGLIYQINAESSGLSMSELSEDKYKQYLDGSVLVKRSVTAEQIAAATITANEILSGTITGDKIAAATIEGSNLKAGIITTAHISSDFGQTLDLSSNTGINQTVSRVYADMGAVENKADAAQSAANSAQSAANSAQASADSKRRVFTSQPVPPYDAGDLWAGGSDTDLMVCAVSRSDGNYDPEDWVLASASVSDLTIGGRNLLTNTNGNNTVITQDYAFAPVDIQETAEAWDRRVTFRVKLNAESGSWKARIRLIAKGAAASTLGDMILALGVLGTFEGLTLDYDSDPISDSGWATVTVQMPSTDFRVQAMIVGTGSASYAYPKLELGNAPTQWTPAPEDVQDSIDAAQEAADEAQTAATNAQSAADAARAVAEAAQQYAEAVRTYAEGIQLQVDGKIDTWFFEGAPSASVSPEKDWTAADKIIHTDDLYYDTRTGYCYRYTGSSWTRIKDSDITTAMSAASAAQDTADNKRRVFTRTPTTPYDIGDLWVEGSAGDMKVCTTARASGGYSASDWSLATASVLAAQAAASAAQTAAGNAQSAADAAQTAAGNAQSTADAAQTAAGNAQSTANAAQTAAGNAQSAAEAAQTAAGNAQTAADEAQTTADSAVTAAGNAQSAANTAQSTADSAVTAAGNAQSTANSAVTAAGNAQSTANAAQTAAGNAQSAADTAQATAETAQSTADTAQSTAEAAQSSAEAAQSSADTAQSTADAAQLSADAAQSSADAAQSTADTAQTTADSAQSAADAAQSTAEAAQSTAEAAQSTADAAQSAANAAQTYAESVRTYAENIQSQLDGKIDTWFYPGPPSASSLPESGWSADDKVQHTDDLYYDTDSGYCYRYTGTDWSRIKDSDITSAMSAASAAQDTADNKRRVFTSQPTPPYDEGDLWAGGSDSDLMVCIQARSTGSFDEADWALASSSVSDLTIGGRNLLLNTSSTDKAISQTFSFTPVNVEETAEAWDSKVTFRVRLNVTTGSWFVRIRLVAKAEACTVLGDMILGRSVLGTGTGSSLDFDSKPVTSPGWATITVTMPSTDYTVQAMIVGTGIVNYSCPKLELGNAPTQWTPAPEDVQSNISTAQQTANNAVTAAGNAQSSADAAQTAADTAQSTATAAQTAAGNAQSTANAAQTAAGNAQSTANAAQTAAGNAQTAAEAAQSTADAAQTAAETAQSSADAAQTAADTAHATAEAAQSYAEAVRTYAEGIQSQVDGKIDTWFYFGAPSASVAPEKDWSTSEKTAHTDDLYYDLTTGFCYRYTGSAWSRIKDSDITSAMTAASTAQDTADNKRRVFTATPRPPYDKGDLWAEGSTGDMKVCTTARASGNYAVSDWSLATASVVAAQTAAGNAQSAANAAQSTADTAQSTATAAQTAAGNAQSAANAAQSSADAAQSTADTAQSTATAAQSAASTAQSTATAAQTAAGNAQSAADAAQSTADTAQSTATAAQTAAGNAQSAANAAQSSADAAQSTADTAHSTATAAQTAAGNAQSAADAAQSTATAAQTAASTAQSTATAAQTAASTAQLTANAAQSAADAAQESIDTLSIGGTNLIWGTLNPNIDAGERPAINGLHADASSSAGELVASSGFMEAVTHGIKIVNTEATRTFIRFGDTASGSLLGLKPGGTYTLSCDAEFLLLSGTTTSTTFSTYFYLFHDAAQTGSFAQGARYLLGALTQPLKGTAMEKRVEWTFTVPDAATMLYFLVANECTTTSEYGVGDYISLDNLKLEHGHRATDWTAAPEDDEEELETKLADIHARISNTGDSIRQEVQANYALASDMSQIAQTVGTLSEQTENNYTWAVTRVNQLQSDLNASRQATEDELAIMRTYMTFGEEGLSIGKTGNPFSFRVVNDRLAFYMNDSEVAYLSNNKLYVTQAEILTRMIIGKFAFEPQSNGNLSLIYKG